MGENILFKPYCIGDVELKNRFVMTGMGTGLPDSDGSVTGEYIAYMRERAKGGAGLLITEVVRPCDGHALTARYQLSAAHDYLIPGIERLACAIHEYGTKIFLQLHHPGRETFDGILNGVSAVAPSAIPCPVNKATTRAITKEEIKELVIQFGQAALRIKQAGVDGIEIHGAHGYLFHQFLSPWTNRRDDEYGGNFDNRFRFLQEVIDEIRKTCGRAFPLAIRFSIEDFMEDQAIDINLGIRIARRLEEADIDLLDVSVGFYETSINNMLETAPHFQGWRNALLKELSDNISHKIPVLAVNATRSLPFANWMISHDLIDLVGMARPFLADPEWVSKAAHDRTEEIRPCLSCVYCVESLRHNANEDDERNTCAVNARAFKETKYPNLKKNGNGRHVSVIGAGPAGMECAMTLAQRGFAVELFERKDRVGGQLNIAARPQNKYRIEALVRYYETMLKKYGVSIHLNKGVEDASLLPDGTEAIFVSTGSVPIIPSSIPGTSGANVYTPEDILTNRIQPRNALIGVIGSGLTGLETAEYLAARSNVVYVFDMLDEIGKEIYFQNREDILSALEPYAVDYFPSHRLSEITDFGIITEDLTVGKERMFKLDGIVLSMGTHPKRDLFERIQIDLEIPIKALGDTRTVGRIKDAVHDGYKSAYEFE